MQIYSFKVSKRLTVKAALTHLKIQWHRSQGNGFVFVLNIYVMIVDRFSYFGVFSTTVILHSLTPGRLQDMLSVH